MLYTEIILHCVSISNQLQQWTNIRTNFSQKSGGSGGRVPPVEKSGEDAVPRVPAPLLRRGVVVSGVRR